MKNIGASVGVVPTQGKKTEEVKEEVKEEEEEEECHQMRNEMVFFLKEAPEYRISAVAEWCENSRGDILTAEPDTYFLHVLTGARCESVWSCLTGWSEPVKARKNGILFASGLTNLKIWNKPSVMKKVLGCKKNGNKQDEKYKSNYRSFSSRSV